MLSALRARVLICCVVAVVSAAWLCAGAAAANPTAQALSVPPGDAAVSVGVAITVPDLDHWTRVVNKLTAGSGNTISSATSTQIALDFLIESYWIETSARRLGVAPTNAQVARVTSYTLRSRSPLGTPYRRFFATLGMTPADIALEVRVSLSDDALARRDEAPVTPAEERRYYRHHPSQFTIPGTPPRTVPFRQVRTQIRQILAEEHQQAASNRVKALILRQWRPYTACRLPYDSPYCANRSAAGSSLGSDNLAAFAQENGLKLPFFRVKP